MNRVWRGVVVTWILIGVATPNVLGLPEFKKAFTDKYAGDGASDDFKKLVRKAGCNVCHVPRQPKDVHNVYGEELEELIPGRAKDRKQQAKEEGREDEEQEKLLAEFEQALEKVAAMTNADGETFGDRIRDEKLPVDMP